MMHLEGTKHIRELFPHVEQIKEPSLKDKVVETWFKMWDESKWECAELAPFSPKVEFSISSTYQLCYRSCLGHRSLGTWLGCPHF